MNRLSSEASTPTYLKFARSFNAQFPGFDTDIHGRVEEPDASGKIRYYMDCVWQR